MKHMAQENVQKPEPEKKDAPVAKPELATEEAPKQVEWEKIPEDKKAEQVKKVKDASEKMTKIKTELEEKRKSEKENKDFLKEKYNYESTSGNPPNMNPEDAGVDEHYLWKVKWEREKLEKDSVPLLKEKHEAETALIAEYKTLEWLSPESKKAAEKAIQTEYLRKSLSSIPLDNPVITWLIDEAKKINPEYDELTDEKKYQLLTRTPSAKAKIAGYLEDYSKVESENLNDAKIQELAKKHFLIESLSGEKLIAFKLPESADALKDPQFVDAAKRGINEKNLEELAKLRWDSLEWKDLPDSIKMAIQFDPYFIMDETKLSVQFREELAEKKAIAREEQQPGETTEQYLTRMKETTGAGPQQATEMMTQSGWNRNKMSPLGWFLADLLAPLFASLPDPAWAMWRNYMRGNSFLSGWTLAERENTTNYGGGRSVWSGGEVQWGMPGYSLDVNGEITEAEKQAVQKIHKAFEWKVEPAMHTKLLTVIERHAKNNPNFSADQPFLAHDVGTKQAFVYFPPGEAVVCWATHGYAGIWNVSGSGATSLGSKRLSEWWSDAKMESRTIVHGLESCNANDEQRLIRVHEWRRGGNSKTEWCTGLPPEIAERLQQTVKTAGGGAQETFNSNSIPSGDEPESSLTENEWAINPNTEKAKEAKEQMTKIVSYDEAKRLIQLGVPPTDPPTIYKIDMSTYKISARYRGNTDPRAWEDAANRNLTDKGKEYIAVHGTASSDISGFHMMLESGLFPYFVSTKWLVFQGADDMTTGSCVSTDTANPNMGKYGLDNFNNRWIAIEVSLEATGGWWIVKPNAAQKKATQQLINTLRWAHDIGAGNVITSADPVRDLNSWNLLPWAHGDDFDDADRAEMGIALTRDVRNRLKTGAFFSDEMATNERLREAQASSSTVSNRSMDWSSNSVSSTTPESSLQSTKGSSNVDLVKQNETGTGTAGVWEFIYWYEKRLDESGNLKVYKLPRWDKWGTYEVAGINDKYHPREAAHLASLIRSGRQDEAKRQAMKYIEQFTQWKNKVISQNRGVNFMMLDATFHRGWWGSASMASYILDGQFSSDWDWNKQARWNQLEKQNPQWLIARIKDARRAYEIYIFGRREQFWAGFESRWDKAQRQANSFA